MATSMPRVALVNLGCRVNRVEIDVIANQLETAGCVISGQEDAELIVINTCAVTGEAQVKTRKAVRHASRLPQRPVVIATGCAATLFADELREAAPDIVIEPNKTLVALRALEAMGVSEHAVLCERHLAVTPTPTGRMRPGIKIQDGCDYRCSYCIVWKARGPSRSLASPRVVEAVREAVGRGAHEVVLTGINLGRYRTGSDDPLGAEAGLERLLELLLEQTDVARIRLSSIEPQDVSEDLLRVMAESCGRVAPFLHVCLQSGCDRTLTRMRRAYTTKLFESVVDQARHYLPGVALGTDVIVGFPGETEQDFDESLEFCRRMAFARMHVFRYSRRPGTPAAEATGQVEAAELARRSTLMRRMATEERTRQMALRDLATDDVLVLEPGRAVDSCLFDVDIAVDVPAGSLTRATLHWDGKRLNARRADAPRKSAMMG